MAATAQDEQKRTGRMKVHAVRGGGGLRLHVREWGKADGPPILFIHGWSQNHLCWARQYQSALAGEFRLIACDLRGHGMSEAPLEREHYTDAKAWAEDVAAIIEELRLDRPVLVGWSYGAFVICDFVRAYGQDRIAANRTVRATSDRDHDLITGGQSREGGVMESRNVETYRAGHEAFNQRTACA